MQTEHLERVFGEVVAFLFLRTLAAMDQVPCPHAGQTCSTTQPCCHLLPWGFVTSCPTEGVLIVGVAQLEHLRRRRVAEEGSRAGGVGRWLSTA